MLTNSLLNIEFIKKHASDAARILDNTSAPEVTNLLQQAPAKHAARIIECMSTLSGSECLKNWPLENAREIFYELNLNIAAIYLRRMEPDDRNRLLDAADKEVAGRLRLLLQFPENSAGAMMDPRILTIQEDIDIAEARSLLERYPQFANYFLYVVNHQKILIGSIDIRDLITAAPQNPVKSIMEPANVKISARANRKAVLAHPGWRKLYVLPVVDDKDVLLGMLHYQILLEQESHKPGEEQQGTLSMFFALGELFWIGTSGMLKSLGSPTDAQLVELNSKEITDGK